MKLRKLLKRPRLPELRRLRKLFRLPKLPKLTDDQKQTAYEGCATGLFAIGVAGLAGSVFAGLAVAGAWGLYNIVKADLKGGA